jgi:hypothetical protein
MTNYIFRGKIIILAILLYSLVSYVQFFEAYSSFPEKIYSKIIDFPCNSVTLNISRYEERFLQVKKMLPASGVIGYVTDSYNYDYDSLSRIYVAQYALAPLIIVRSSKPSFIIGNHGEKFAGKINNPNSDISLLVTYGDGLMLFRRY